MNISWFDGCIMYQIFPLGLCGAPHENSWDWSNTWNAASRPVRRIDRVLGWIEQLKKLSVNTVYFNPVLQSDTHGYNTRDFYTLDSRLGSNEDFSDVCLKLRENGFRIVLDAHFNHVGRGFWAFRDVRENMEKSKYINWFRGIDFKSNTPCNDGFYYSAWEDNWDFPQLNLDNEEVVEHLFGAVRKWSELFDFDGLRIAIVDCVDKKFMERFRSLCADMSAGHGGSIALLGQVHAAAEYNQFLNESCVHSVTNYELYHAVVNSFRSGNLFELFYTLNRQFTADGIYKNVPLMNFLDNHDIPRIASLLQDADLLKIAYGLLFALPGFPSVYYGSEWGVSGQGFENHWERRQTFEHPEWNELTDFIQKVAALRKDSPALRFGSYRIVSFTRGAMIFERLSCGQRFFVALNIGEGEARLEVKGGAGYESFAGMSGAYADLISGNSYAFDGSVTLPPRSIQYLNAE